MGAKQVGKYLRRYSSPTHKHQRWSTRRTLVIICLSVCTQILLEPFNRHVSVPTFQAVPIAFWNWCRTVYSSGGSEEVCCTLNMYLSFGLWIVLLKIQIIIDIRKEFQRWGKVTARLSGDCSQPITNELWIFFPHYNVVMLLVAGAQPLLTLRKLHWYRSQARRKPPNYPSKLLLSCFDVNQADTIAQFLYLGISRLFATISAHEAEYSCVGGRWSICMNNVWERALQVCATISKRRDLWLIE